VRRDGLKYRRPSIAGQSENSYVAGPVVRARADYRHRRRLLPVLELPGCPVLDKNALVGGCVRLPLAFDAQGVRHEIDALPPQWWGSRGGRVGVHRQAEAIFLRGHAPAEGDLPIEDRPALAALPHTRRLIHDLVPGTPMRCLLAKLPPGAVVAPHIDRAPYFHQTIRVHVPVVTHEHAHMFCAGRFYRMQAAEIWALNNIAVHAVWNADSVRDRIHLICDYVPGQGLLELLRSGQRDLGYVDVERERALTQHVERSVQGPAP
jgi:hypothetical protein